MEFIKPEELHIRDAWKREDKDFTPWLSTNLDFLNELGLGELSLIKTEVSVPGISRRLDILAETSDGKRIAIENQFNSLDHDHMTRGLAYAVGLNTKALVIIAEDHRPEFRAVAEYLNNSAEVLNEDGVHIFLVSVKVERVGDFVIPRFEIVEEPNSWKMEISDSDIGRELSDSDKRRRSSRVNFWRDFLDIYRSQESAEHFTRSKPHVGNGIYMSAQIQGVRSYWAEVLLQNSVAPRFSFEDSAEVNDLFFNSVYAMKTEIESKFGTELKWEHTKGATTTRITGPYTEDCGWGTDDELRRENIPRAINDMEGFIQTLSTYIDKAYESINSELMELNL